MKWGTEKYARPKGSLYTFTLFHLYIHNEKSKQRKIYIYQNVVFFFDLWPVVCGSINDISSIMSNISIILPRRECGALSIIKRVLRLNNTLLHVFLFYIEVLFYRTFYFTKKKSTLHTIIIYYSNGMSIITLFIN